MQETTINTKYTDVNDLPLCLKVADVSKVLGIGITYAYQLVKSKDFPKLTIGKRIIPKTIFVIPHVALIARTINFPKTTIIKRINKTVNILITSIDVIVLHINLYVYSRSCKIAYPILLSAKI